MLDSFIERLWRSLKYEEVFIKAYASVREARLGIGVWIKFYNNERKNQVLGHKTPSKVFAVTENNDVQAYGYDGQNKNVLPTSLQAQQQPKEKDSKHERKVISLDNELLAA